MKKHVGIIGAGIGGLASAIRLASDGFRVTVLEKNEKAGGKLGELREDGYRFDTGPTVFTMPELVNELFLKAGKDPSEYFTFQSLDQSCRYFYEDATTIDAYSDQKLFAEELAAKTGESEQKILRFLKKSNNLYDLTANVFLFNSIHDPRNLLNKDSLKALMNFHKLDAFKTMHEVNQKWFSSEKVVQLFDRYATYNGSSPYRAPGTLNVIPHLEHNMGVYFPVKGMYSIVEALQKLAESQGVEFRFGMPVERVETGDNEVEKVITNREEYRFDYVVNDSDVHYFYSHLLGNQKFLRKHLKPEKSSSALIFFWGVMNRFSNLKMHNILFSGDYRAEFHHLFNRKLIYKDPTVYIFISSKAISEDAPVGSENWYVMINAPENTGQNWTKLIKNARRNIVLKINRMLGINIERFIATERVMYPGTIEENTSAWHGSLYGNSSNGKYAAFYRHPNFSKKYKNLFFTGGSVHPGGGIPLCLASAKIVEDKIKGK
ncbi:MAG: 1-hydroxycarotenoid 3,4-desaturase CrtD [Bacteroidales bacterium]|nr:phytoene desaturase [Bacteroidales bacterium]MBS3776639.1 phytoene desaturase [Bacteroidales bacterium]